MKIVFMDFMLFDPETSLVKCGRSTETSSIIIYSVELSASSIKN